MIDGLMSMVASWARSTSLIFHLTKGSIKLSSFLVITESSARSCKSITSLYVEGGDM